MNVKILVVYHKRAKVIENDIFVPIRVGDMQNNPDGEYLVQNMSGDDTGDNISHKNPTYNELTAVYWAWKNYDKLGNPERIGLCHYRRHFVWEKRSAPYYEIKDIGKDFYSSIQFSADNVESLLNQGDFVAPMPAKRLSVKDNYKRAHNGEDLARAENILRDKYPEYLAAAQRYLNGSKSYFYNMFVFDKDTFFRYCGWLFDILQEFEATAVKPLGRLFISERLTGIFFTKLIEEGKEPVHLPTLFATGKKESLSSSIARTKSNLKTKNSGLVYALKPIIVYFIPNFIMRARRMRKCK